MVKDASKKTEMIGFRATKELNEKITKISEIENKTISIVVQDACKLYIELFPIMHALKSKKLYPALAINEEVIKEEIYNTVKKLI